MTKYIHNSRQRRNSSRKSRKPMLRGAKWGWERATMPIRSRKNRKQQRKAGARG